MAEKNTRDEATPQDEPQAVDFKLQEGTAGAPQGREKGQGQGGGCG